MPYFIAVIIIAFSLLSITQVVLSSNNNSYKARSLSNFHQITSEWQCAYTLSKQEAK
jgi:hypothetical protein